GVRWFHQVEIKPGLPGTPAVFPGPVRRQGNKQLAASVALFGDGWPQVLPDEVGLRILPQENLLVTAMDPQRISTMFRAVSDPTRLRILRLLQAGEFCVGDLVTVLDLPQPSASRHLAYLRDAGLVADRKQGLWVYYSLTPP